MLTSYNRDDASSAVIVFRTACLTVHGWEVDISIDSFLLLYCFYLEIWHSFRLKSGCAKWSEVSWKAYTPKIAMGSSTLFALGMLGIFELLIFLFIMSVIIGIGIFICRRCRRKNTAVYSGGCAVCALASFVVIFRFLFRYSANYHHRNRFQSRRCNH